MNILKLTIFFLLVSLFSCRQKEIKHKHKVNPKAEVFYEQTIPLFTYTDNPDSCKKAVLLLDSATIIDDSCFNCYFNKLFFLDTLRQLEKIASTYNNLIRLRPNNGQLYLYRGRFYEQNGDTISSKYDFQKSLKIYNNVLDTMNSKNMNYSYVLFDKALILIMLDEQEKGNRLLKQLCDEEKNEIFKEVICSYVNKTKKELLTFRPPDHSQAIIYSEKN